ncbi:MAG: DNA repair protein RecN [Flavobacteriales bacterium]|jgi:DNA repair protein RecN (Recombination protein N)|nr:DNA repair protein RecN [Flavobacteriales bacterium]MBT5089557.1 DNA repair protein RecN [Flavobacteriales bacterium]
MIKSLHIQNYALLKNVFINFSDGFTVVSGETGAGKSIILDALSLLLGKRVGRFSADGNRYKSTVEAIFSIDSSEKQFFSDNNLDFEEETIVRREINAIGKSRAFINDTPVLLQVLTTFGKQIIEIHSQHQSVLLKDEEAQFLLIDQLAKSEKELTNYQNELKQYTALVSKLNVIKKAGNLSSSELDFLQFQFEELNTANLIENEKEDIENNISLLENIDGISNAIAEGEHYLNNEQGVLTSLSVVKRKLIEFDTFNELSARLEAVLIELNDINAELSAINNKLNADPEQLLKLNNRLDVLNNLLLKHRKQFIEELIDLKHEIEQKIHLSSSFEMQVIAKQKEIEKQILVLKAAAEVLNAKRNKVLPIIKQQLQGHLHQLGMPYAKFEIVFAEIDQFHQNGNTNISFLFSANKGIPLQKVDKVASGGELSRLMLVIKYITAQLSKVNILIFDEIDIGVSGEIASLMGDMMLKISKENQLIAISHLPQIASKANNHLKVVKKVVDNKTISDVVALNKQQRIEEIAKLLSGKKLTKAAFDNAEELLNQ